MGVDGLPVKAVVGGALALHCALTRHEAALPNAGRVFARPGAEQRFGRQRRDFNMQVNAVHQGAAEFGLVAVDLVGCAAAAVLWRAQVAAGAGIHGGNQLKPRWEFSAPRGPRNGDRAGLQRFAQGL